MLRKWMWLSFGLWVSCLLSSGLDSVALAQSAGQLSENHPLMQQRRAKLEGVTIRLKENAERIDEIDRSIAAMEHEVEAIGALLQSNHVAEVSYPEILMQLQVQRINLSIEKAGLDAKADKLVELSNTPTEGQVNERIEAKREKLRELLHLEEQALSRANALSKSGVIPMSEISELRRRVLQAEVQLLDLDSPQQPQTRETIWAAELLSKISLDRIEVAAKLAKIDDLLKPMQELRPQLSVLQTKKREIEPFRDQKAQLMARQADLESNLRQLEMGLDSAEEQSNDQ